jgi:putative phosphoesterase
MHIGIVSDTHDRAATLSQALDELRRRGVTVVLHCGDIESPSMISLFEGLTAHFVYGNCDDDRSGLRTAISALGATLHEPFGHLELTGRRLAFLHGDDAALQRDLENSAHFDFLFHGHTHQIEDRRVGPTRVINPGALHRARPKSFAVLELETGRLETLAVENEPRT